MSGSTSAASGEAALFETIERGVRACQQAGALGPPAEPLIPKWRRLVAQEPQRLLDSAGRLRREALRRFRHHQVFVPDVPAWDPQRFSLISLLGGGRRGDRRMLDECLDIVRRSSAEPLLRKYPCPPIGSPHVFRRHGYVYSYRWLKHIWSLALLREVLGPRLPAEFIALDIGSSYGIFSGLVKREWPASHHILVDFPEQLIPAHYFLGRWLPGARIAGMDAVLEQPRLTRAWVEQFDVVLVPCTRFERLAAGCADLVSNFASFGEMTRTWFDFYLRSPAVTSARYVFFVNRIQSRPTYDTDLTVLDYPMWDPARRLHFAISPVFSEPYWYPRRWGFFTRKVANAPYFEYLGLGQGVSASATTERAGQLEEVRVA